MKIITPGRLQEEIYFFHLVTWGYSQKIGVFLCKSVIVSDVILICSTSLHMAQLLPVLPGAHIIRLVLLIRHLVCIGLFLTQKLNKGLNLQSSDY